MRRRRARTPPEPGVDSPERHAGAPRCTTRVENAHGTVVREVLYRWHPWFGLAVHVHAAIPQSDGGYFRSTLDGAAGARVLLTDLMARLILDHARLDGAAPSKEVNDDLCEDPSSPSGAQGAALRAPVLVASGFAQP